MTQKISHNKRAYGYMSCMILMFVMVSTYPTASSLTNENILANREVQNKVTVPKHVEIPAKTNRIYRINNEVVTVDTSKPGWAVSLLLDDSSKSN